MPTMAQYVARTRRPAPIPKKQGRRRPARIEWPKRPRRDRIATARRWMWTSLCRRYRLVRLSSLLVIEPDVWLVMRLRTVEGNTGYDIVSRHQKRTAAQREADRLAREEARRCPR